MSLRLVPAGARVRLGAGPNAPVRLPGTGAAAVGPDFNAELVPNIYAWYDFSALALNDGDQITTVDDRSVENRIISQATAARRPIFKVNVQGGRGVGRFSGGDVDNDFLDQSAGSVGLGQPDTIVVVYNDTGPTGSSRNALDDIGVGQAVWRNAADRPSIYGGALLSSPSAISGPTFCVDYAEFNGASSYLRRNGVQIAAGDAGSAALAGGIRVGADTATTGGWIGDIGEVIYYQGAVSAGNRSLIEAGLMAKWSIT